MRRIIKVNVVGRWFADMTNGRYISDTTAGLVDYINSNLMKVKNENWIESKNKFWYNIARGIK